MNKVVLLCCSCDVGVSDDDAAAAAGCDQGCCVPSSLLAPAPACPALLAVGVARGQCSLLFYSFVSFIQYVVRRQTFDYIS